MNSICQNEQLLDNILKFIGDDRPTRLSLSYVSKRIRSHVKENARFHKLAFYILSNYVIVSTNMERCHLWHSLKYCKLLSFGEKHGDCYDRFGNAWCINMMWKEGQMSLILETPPQIGEGMLSYVKKEIAEQGKSWDMPEWMKSISAFASNMLRSSLWKQIRTYLLLCNELYGFKHDFTSMDSFYKKALGFRDLILLDEKKMPMPKANTDVNDSFLWIADMRVALKDAGEKLLEKFIEGKKSLEEVDKLSDNLRNSFFVNKMKQETGSNQVISLSGPLHNLEDSPLVKAAKQNKIPHISAISYRTFTECSKLQSIEKKSQNTSFLDISIEEMCGMREAFLKNETEFFEEKFGYERLYALGFVLQKEIKDHASIIKQIRLNFSLNSKQKTRLFDTSKDNTDDLYK